MTRVQHGYFTAGLIDALNGAIILAMPYFALHIGAGNMGTIANIVNTALYTVTCLFASRIRIIKNQRSNLAIGMFLIAAACFLAVGVKNIGTLITTSFLLGMGNAFFYPTLQTWITEGMDKPQLIKTMGGYSVAWVLGFLVGPSIGGYILVSDILGLNNLNARLNVIFLGSAIVSLLVGISFIFDKYKQILLPVSINEIPKAFIQEVSQEKCRLFLYIMWISIFCSLFVCGLIRFIFTEMGKSENLSSLTIGNINSIMYFSLIVLVLFMRKYTFWLFSFRYLILFQILSLVAIFFFVFTKSVILYFAGAVVFGFLLAFTFFSSSFYSLIFEGKKDAYININEALVGLGGVMAGLLGYILAEFISVKYSFFPGIIILIMAMLAETIIYTKWNNKQKIRIV
ncbi:MAG: MFS transporter [Elusimicrobia bacterium]|nr:MFS transporter [Elusimicrobiota bacterium]